MDAEMVEKIHQIIALADEADDEALRINEMYGLDRGLISLFFPPRPAKRALYDAIHGLRRPEKNQLLAVCWTGRACPKLPFQDWVHHAARTFRSEEIAGYASEKPLSDYLRKGLEILFGGDGSSGV